jgi:hypothetical protein
MRPDYWQVDAEDRRRVAERQARADRHFWVVFVALVAFWLGLFLGAYR